MSLTDVHWSHQAVACVCRLCLVAWQAVLATCPQHVIHSCVWRCSWARPVSASLTAEDCQPPAHMVQEDMSSIEDDESPGWRYQSAARRLPCSMHFTHNAFGSDHAYIHAYALKTVSYAMEGCLTRGETLLQSNNSECPAERKFVSSVSNVHWSTAPQA